MFKRNISTKNLGVPLRVAKLKRKDWSGIIEKIQKKKNYRVGKVNSHRWKEE